MFEDKRLVPYSSRRYWVTMNGKVIDSVGNILPTYVENGERFIELEWIRGKSHYSFGMVILAAYGILDMEEYFWDEIEPLFKDGKSSNFTPANLTYRFRNGPIEVQSRPGYYYVPFFTRYGISRTGEMINIVTGQVLTWMTTKPDPIRNSIGGYNYARAVSIHGQSKIIFRHRALAFTFIKYCGNFDKLIVNHKDGNPSNDSIDNLEWCTYSENNQHAYDNGLKVNSSRAVLIKNLKTGEIRSFPTISLCHRQTGLLTPSIIQYRLQHSTDKVFADLLAFKYDDGSSWPNIDIEKLEICRNGDGDDIVARNVFTGEQVIFCGGYAGEKLLGIKHGTILQHVRENKLLPVNGWNFRYLIGGDKFPEHTHRHLMVYDKYPIKSPDGVIVTDVESGEEEFFCSKEEAAEKFKLSFAYVHTLAANEQVYKSKFKFKVFKLRDQLSPAVE